MFRFIFIYTLLVISLVTNGIHAFVFLTVWNLILQSFYFYLFEREIRTEYFFYLQNILWTLSPIFIAYWGLSSGWNHSVLWYDISIHGINVLIFWHTLFPTHGIHLKYLWASYLVLVSYLCMAYGYTYLIGPIYPTNLFVVSHLWLYLFLLIFIVPLNHLILPPSVPKRSDCLKV